MEVAMLLALSGLVYIGTPQVLSPDGASLQLLPKWELAQNTLGVEDHLHWEQP